jgi:hypothetical protein
VELEFDLARDLDAALQEVQASHQPGAPSAERGPAGHPQEQHGGEPIIRIGLSGRSRCGS